MRWRWGLLAGVALALLSLYPQLRLWHTRGGAWQGAYAYNDIDEVAYAAYLNALITGRPRRNDPYTGNDATSPESIFSIQFATPCAVALLARLSGLNASQTMILFAALTGLATGLALFWLLATLTGNERLAAAGALLVVCCGALACWQGAVGYLRGFGPAYPFPPAFRRYLPAGAFPVFFIFAAFVWRSLVLTQRRRDTETQSFFPACVAASVCFASLVFSYFYLWTTALAWFVCLALLWLLARRDNWRVFLGLGAACGAVLLPYSWLLAQRGEATDAVQLLERTHAPDLLRLPELLGLVALLILLAGVWRKRIGLKEPLTLFAAAFALTPLIVFNQQTITGRSLQPIHYEVFIGNYVALLALVLSIAAWSTNFSLLLGAVKQTKVCAPHWLLLVVGCAALAWGFYEAKVTAAVLDEANLRRDRAWPVLQRLGADCRMGQTVFTSDSVLADELPTVAPCGVLWARHLQIFTGVSWDVSKERFYQQLYWMALDENWLEAQLRARQFVVVYALFGWGRLSNRLVTNPQPLTDGEITTEVSRYAAFRANFNHEAAARAPLSHVVIPAEETFPPRLAQFYERDAGAQSGDYLLYRVQLRQP